MDPSIALLAADGIKKSAMTPVSIAQMFFGQKKARKAEKQLMGMVDNYKPSESIMDYYNKALAKYNSNPYQSQTYGQAMNMANRNMAAGIGGLQDRRSAIGGISSLVQGSNDAALKAAATAEQLQNQNFSQLGDATTMKDREDKYKFENKYNLLSQKAGGGNQLFNAGMKNLLG